MRASEKKSTHKLRRQPISEKPVNSTADDAPEIQFAVELPLFFAKLQLWYRNGRLTRVRFWRERAGGPWSAGAQLPPSKAACPAREAWLQHSKRGEVRRRGRDETLEERLRADFRDYFSGREVAFDYPLDVENATPFQQAVWAAMRQITYGQTRSYQRIAEKIGRPRAARAVGNACGRNPLPIIQPCHRVVGSNGRLGGFSGGLDLKKALLELEGIDLSRLR